ncbi:MAG: hypothetical protein VR65_04815 [Desulfobulbaceae bacterium BRH_c16a]|nr:MAG: hypothetical protein VR65_04230 [Desulfobulbaceae bacterium BRH_c16a]KJS02750.1 MAG: hypothetical protein VR65_04815 [Desulfobulbaceae bacterium BRH_c16a]
MQKNPVSKTLPGFGPDRAFRYQKNSGRRSPGHQPDTKMFSNNRRHRVDMVPVALLAGII